MSGSIGRLPEQWQGGKGLRIRAFNALQPPGELAPDLASVPYDVISTAEARELVARKPWSFLHVVRPEVDLGEDADPYSGAVSAKAHENLRRFCEHGALVRDPARAVYVYRMVMDGRAQLGVMACLHVDDVDRNTIRRHETTREDKLRDRIRLIDTLGAHAGPVLMTYRDDPAITELLHACEREEPLYDFKAHFDVRHTVWRVESSEALVDAFSRVEAAYVADGHHRLAAACEVARKRRPGATAAGRGDGVESDWFLAALFPAGELRVLSYNRCVADLNGLTTEQFLAACEARFEPVVLATGRPVQPGDIAVYVAGAWHGLRCPADRPGADDPVGGLDVSYLQDALLGPVLGIEDPRRDARIDFVGGIEGRAAVQRRVDRGEAAVGFCLYPVSVNQIMAIADDGCIMPPKSTWFEPKLRSGLLVHTF